MRVNVFLSAILLVTGAWSSKALPQPATDDPEPAANAYHAHPETDKCIKSAHDDGRPAISITIGKVVQAKKFAKIALSIDNLTRSPIWMNLHPDALGGGLPREQQLFVTIHAPQN